MTPKVCTAMRRKKGASKSGCTLAIRNSTCIVTGVASAEGRGQPRGGGRGGGGITATAIHIIVAGARHATGTVTISISDRVSMSSGRMPTMRRSFLAGPGNRPHFISACSGVGSGGHDVSRGRALVRGIEVFCILTAAIPCGSEAVASASETATMRLLGRGISRLVLSLPTVFAISIRVCQTLASRGQGGGTVSVSGGIMASITVRRPSVRGATGSGSSSNLVGVRVINPKAGVRRAAVLAVFETRKAIAEIRDARVRISTYWRSTTYRSNSQTKYGRQSAFTTLKQLTRSVPWGTGNYDSS